MKCPFCQAPENKVLDSRESQEGAVTRRRRECVGCGQRFTTYERVEELMPLVVKKDGRREARGVARRVPRPAKRQARPALVSRSAISGMTVSGI